MFNKCLVLICLPNSASLPPRLSKTFMQKYQFWIMLLAALIILQIPFVSIPFKWLESYFHEISHGIAALVTGGVVVKIQLFPNGAGLCTTRGGSDFFISFMGYAGATIWGSIIYITAVSHRKIASVFAVALVLLLGLSIVFWVRDILTLIIVLVLLLITIAQYRLSSKRYLQPAMQITGLLVLLNSLQSPLYLIDGRVLGDGAALAKITFIPEFLWVVVWFLLALFSAMKLSKLTVNTQK